MACSPGCCLRRPGGEEFAKESAVFFLTPPGGDCKRIREGDGGSRIEDRGWRIEDRTGGRPPADSLSFRSSLLAPRIFPAPSGGAEPGVLQYAVPGARVAAASAAGGPEIHLLPHTTPPPAAPGPVAPARAWHERAG